VARAATLQCRSCPCTGETKSAVHRFAAIRMASLNGVLAGARSGGSSRHCALQRVGATGETKTRRKQPGGHKREVQRASAGSSRRPEPVTALKPPPRHLQAKTDHPSPSAQESRLLLNRLATSALRRMFSAAEADPPLGNQPFGPRSYPPLAASMRGVMISTLPANPVNEAICSMALEAGQPLYLAGGFGGITHDIAIALGFDDGKWMPRRPDDPAPDPRTIAGLSRIGDVSRLAGGVKNGLTADENRRLAASHRPSDIAALLSMGLGRLLGN
jgi:hypothetical protein